MQGLTWDVCESIWMSDEIKLKGAAAKEEVTAWKETLKNLGEAGVKTVCYNFMPVVDWTRTDLDYTPRSDKMPIKTTKWNAVSKAKKRLSEKTAEEIKLLEKNIIAGLPGGAESHAEGEFAKRVSKFNDISDDDMRDNLVSFLNAVIPTAEKYGITLAIHPDDPPFSLFGLPRIMAILDMISIVKALIRADSSKTRSSSIYMRPDHGHLLAFEKDSKVNPGYSYLGRLKGMAELRGVMQAVEHFTHS
ncbi:Mannonate dehydratase 2 [Nymphon striatum]|nr:Mannonate dehydratase 2 [Nymphon striatum]